MKYPKPSLGDQLHLQKSGFQMGAFVLDKRSEEFREGRRVGSAQDRTTIQILWLDTKDVEECRIKDLLPTYIPATRIQTKPDVTHIETPRGKLRIIHTKSNEKEASLRLKGYPKAVDWVLEQLTKNNL